MTKQENGYIMNIGDKFTDIDKAIKILQKYSEMGEVNETLIGDVVAAYTEAKTPVLSSYTLRDYSLTFRRLLEFLPEEMYIHEIPAKTLRAFLTTIPGSKKTRKNAHIALGALWTFALKEGYATDHIIRRDVEIAKPEVRAIIPFSREEVSKLAAAAKESENPLRNVAVIKVLLDTGLRASELCGLKLEDLEGDYLRVFGKGSKERRVPITALAMSAIVDYLGLRKADKRNAPVFLSKTGVALNRDSLRLLINRLALAAGVNNAHPHKFRHTFALNYLLNGGDAYTLQMILGHSTMDMVKRYIYLTSKDLAAVHNRVSPLRIWGLE